MTQDELIEELRRMPPRGGVVGIAVCREAADTIAALRAALQRLLTACEDTAGTEQISAEDWDEVCAAMEQARAVLAVPEVRALERARELIGEARLTLDTGAVMIGETNDYPPGTILHVLDKLDAALAALKGGAP